MDAFLKQAMNGNQENVKELYEQTKNQVYLLCSSLIKDQQEVDFIFTDVYKEIWKVAPQKNLESVKDFKELLMKTAIKFCQNKEFSGNPHVFRDNKPVEFETVDYKPTKATISYEEALKACEGLNDPCRFIFISSLISGLSFRQIGQAINVEEIVVNSYFESALALLKDKKVNEFKSAFNTIKDVPQTTNTSAIQYIESITKNGSSKPKWILPVILVIAIIGGIFGFMSMNSTKNYVADIVVKDYGTITVELNSEVAPKTVENFVKLANDGFYDGLTFHRIMDGFMIQGGDPNGNGTGGSSQDIEGEFEANGHKNDLSHVRGTISMARSQDYNSASSQFFIVQTDSLFLDGQYAAFGTVTSSMEIVDQICKDKIPYDDNGSIVSTDQPIIETITIKEK